MAELTAIQEREVRRLMAAGLDEGRATALATERPFDVPPAPAGEGAAPGEGPAAAGTAYYSFLRPDGSLSGLLRFAWPGPVAAYADRDRGGWVEKPELLRHLIEGTPDLERVGAGQAAELARRYGVDLVGPA